MNNFKKEELEFIKYCVESWRGEYGMVADLNFIKKIEYMINNYCDHQWSASDSECLKCGEKQ